MSDHRASVQGSKGCNSWIVAFWGGKLTGVGTLNSPDNNRATGGHASQVEPGENDSSGIVEG